MTAVSPDAVCRVAGCGGPAAGVCINGLAFNECPDVVPAEAAQAVEDEEETSEPDREHVVTGQPSSLDEAGADAFLRANGGVLLALVSGPNVGKTTLVGTFYELAHRGRLPALGFAGSETILGLEERCFLSRAASLGEVAETARTPRSGGPRFLHLRLATAGDARHDLLLSDRSGEDFEEAVDSPDALARFGELARADALLVLVDAERLHSAHHAETARVRRLLVALGHAGVAAGRPVMLVATKLDRLAGDEQRATVERRARQLLEEVERRMPGSRAQLHFTACRARPGAAAFGEGVAALLAAILPAPTVRTFTTTYWNPGTGGTALDRLMHGVPLD